MWYLTVLTEIPSSVAISSFFLCSKRLFLKTRLHSIFEYILLNYLRFLLFENYHKRRTVLEVIQCLSQLYIHSKISLLRDFDLLYRAKKEIDETGKQVSWTRDTLEPKNIDSYIINYLDTLSKTGILSM